ncbi:MAG: hypothetical protein KYX66_12350 [Blastomonas fulva]|uniref:hypothetical protein n=1 Tax=Blastomonas fulva TaxID=1550728 RepID=UPI0024E27857|nr:hypothetical protein [Blastomonas fulva]MDK2757516.1 hypothetical protein [Blastomonas fulva]
MEMDIEATFKGFNCQVQRAGNNEIENRDGKVAVKVCTMPDGNPQMLVMIGHADGVTNCAVLDQTHYLRLVLLLGEAGGEASQIAAAAAKATVQ